MMAVLRGGGVTVSANDLIVVSRETGGGMAFDDGKLADIFTYHPPTAVQQTNYEAIREGALTFARILVANTPPSADQTAALRKLRECVMTANAAVALQGQF